MWLSNGSVVSLSLPSSGCPHLLEQRSLPPPRLSSNLWKKGRSEHTSRHYKDKKWKLQMSVFSMRCPNTVTSAYAAVGEAEGCCQTPHCKSGSSVSAGRRNSGEGES